MNQGREALKDKNGEYTDAYFFNYLNRKPRVPIMATYYLQFGQPDFQPDTVTGLLRDDDRPFIDARIHAGCQEIARTTADTWLQARDNLSHYII